MDDLAGHLTLRLAWSDGTPRVEVHSTRRRAAARLFIGRDTEATVRLLPSLYNLCATAQAVACSEAIEQARGRVAPLDVRRHRRRLVAAETVREHLWRVLLDWPRAVSTAADEPAMARAIELYARWRRALGSGDLAPGAKRAEPAEGALGERTSDAQAALAELVAERILARSPEAWLAEVADTASLARWSQEADTVAARLIRRLLQSELAGLGRCDVPPLPQLRRSTLTEALAGAGASAFLTEPTWAGRAHETSPFTRSLDRPLLKDLVDRYGNGLISRLAASLIEIARLCGPTPEGHEAEDQACDDPSEPLEDGIGLGVAAAARGLLVHRVVLANDRILDYAILAPTEWNFHPDGVIARGLAALMASPGDADTDLARLLITAVDPCVAFDLVGDLRPPRTTNNSPLPTTH